MDTEPIATAEATMSQDTAGKLLELLSQGVALDKACWDVLTAATLNQFIQPPDDMLRFVHRTIPVASVPNAKCVADRLRGKAPPTREDIEAALAACARR